MIGFSSPALGYDANAATLCARCDGAVKDGWQVRRVGHTRVYARLRRAMGAAAADRLTLGSYPRRAHAERPGESSAHPVFRVGTARIIAQAQSRGSGRARAHPTVRN